VPTATCSRPRGGATTWRALQSATPAQWLDHLVSRALLAGELPPDAAAGSFLGQVQERNLWEQAIARDAGAAAELFDREGMALAAMEAASLQRCWRIEVPSGPAHRRIRRPSCAGARPVEAPAAPAAGAAGTTSWPGASPASNAGWAACRRASAWPASSCPTRWSRACWWCWKSAASNCSASISAMPRQSAGARHRMRRRGSRMPCRGGLGPGNAWRRDDARLRLRIAVADLPARRRQLDAALAPPCMGRPSAPAGRRRNATTNSSAANRWRRSRWSPRRCRCLQIYAVPRRIAQAEFGALLCAPGWSADIDEADARARIEAGLREKLPPEATLERYARRSAASPLGFPHRALGKASMRCWTAVRAASRRQAPSAWGLTFGQLLAALGWPGQRPLLAAEAAAADALDELIAGLQALDAILGRIDRNEALRQLRRQCRDRRLPRAASRRAARRGLQPRRGAGRSGRWPLGDRPQRRRLAAGAAPQSAAAGGVAAPRRGSPPRAPTAWPMPRAKQQALWCASAAEVVFSWSLQEGEKALRRSPLLDELAHDAGAGCDGRSHR
jgi:hypothetical protein